MKKMIWRNNDGENEIIIMKMMYNSISNEK